MKPQTQQYIFDFVKTFATILAIALVGALAGGLIAAHLW
jgi:hypothetical protein